MSFISQYEDFPWFQWMVAEEPSKTINLTEVVIGIPRRCCGYHKLKKRILDQRFEVRAGSKKLDASFRGTISLNEMCDGYRPSNPVLVKGEYAKYTFSCNTKKSYIRTTYITVQMLGGGILAISEIDAYFIQKSPKKPKGKLPYKFSKQKIEK